MNETLTGVPLSTVKTTMFIFVTMLVLAIPKIFISNHIYYMSKIVNNLNQDVAVLESQNEMLVDNIEQLKYKREIKDMIECEPE